MRAMITVIISSGEVWRVEREREKGTEGRSKASVQASDNEFARGGERAYEQLVILHRHKLPATIDRSSAPLPASMPR